MSQPTSSAAGFAVDLAAASDAIRELENAKSQLESIRKDAYTLGRVVPPANDAVSVDAARALGAAAVGGPGSLVAALDAGVERLQELIDALRADLAGYRTSEDQGENAFSAPDRS